MIELEMLRGDIQSHVEEELVRDTTMVLKIQKLEEKLDKVTEQVDTLLNLWQRGLGVITFIKWCLGISTGMTALFVFIKEHIK